MGQNERQESLPTIIEYGFLQMLLLGGMAQQYGELIGLKPWQVMELYLAALLAVVVCMAASLAGGAARYAAVFPAVCALAVCFFAPVSVLRGMVVMVNTLIGCWNFRYDDAIRLLEFPAGSGAVRAGTLAFAVVWLFSCSALIWYLLRRRRLRRAGAILAVFVLLGVLVGRCSVTSCGVCMVYVFTCMHLRCHRIWTRRWTRQEGVWLAGSGACLLLAAVLAGDTTLSGISFAKSAAAEWTEALRYGADTLPEGDLRQAAGMKRGGEPALRVTTEQAHDLYLRGYVGACYEDGCWSPLKRAAFRGEQAGQVRWLEERDFSSARQYAAYREAGGAETANRITVENIGADRESLYLPYSADMPVQAGVAQNRDGGLVSTRLRGSRSYSCAEYGGNLPPELLTLEEWTAEPETEEQKAFLQEERVYAAFVRNHYLEVEDELEPLVRDLFFLAEEAMPDRSVCAVTTVIRQKLESMVSYCDPVPDLPQDTDPVQWFLSDGRRGNAFLYASVAVQAFRVYGIPARYAEGYLFSQEQAQAADGKPVELRADAVHAWAEVYMDGIGWVPIDVTPGYYYDTYGLIALLDGEGGVRKTTGTREAMTDGISIWEEDTPEPASAEPEPGTGENHLGRWLVLWISLVIFLAAVLEILRAVRLMYGMYGMYHGSGRERAERICAAVLNGMQAAGVDAQPGWKTRETGQQLAGELPELSEDDYRHVSGIIMKLTYGGMLLDAEEEEYLLGFLARLRRAVRRKGWRRRLRFRYYGLLRL